jgi:omega-6 fatty acid desaturase (delta-12 desaturase)
MPSDDTAAPTTGKQLLDATRPFATESPLRSWWSVGSTLVLLGAALLAAATAPWWPVQLAASVLGGLLFVRGFILYHDFMHHSLLRDSRLARPLFHLIGMFLLAPPRYWRYSHNFHHGNVGKPLQPGSDRELLVTSDLGSFPLMTTDAWRTASTLERLRYRVARHPLMLACAYVTVFMLGLCLLPLLKSPRKYWDGALALVAHAGLVGALWFFVGFPVLFFAFLLPFAIASAIGAYLFYAQHNYEGMHVLKSEEWTYYRGAIESSSYMRLGRVMDWFTGNIGYHHIHHMNPLIPFYRLPEAMAAVPGLQEARTTSLHPREILGCLRLGLWDPVGQRLVSYREARKAREAA